MNCARVSRKRASFYIGVPMHDVTTGRVNRISLGLHPHQPTGRQSRSRARLRGFAPVFHMTENQRCWKVNPGHGCQSPQEEPPPGRRWRFRLIEKIKRTLCRVFASPVAFPGERPSLGGQIRPNSRCNSRNLPRAGFMAEPNPTRRADIDSDPQEWQRRCRTVGRSDRPG
jgi:hypothetical protein